MLIKNRAVNSPQYFLEYDFEPPKKNPHFGALKSFEPPYMYLYYPWDPPLPSPLQHYPSEEFTVLNTQVT